MTTTVENTLTGAMAIMSGVLGGKLSLVIAEATSQEHPWMSMIIGPMGALVGTVIGLVWMSNRLNKADAKAAKNEEILIDLVKQVTACATSSAEAVRNSTLAIQKNSDYLEDAHDTLKDFKS